jgi:hypothetical protein
MLPLQTLPTVSKEGRSSDDISYRIWAILLVFYSSHSKCNSVSCWMYREVFWEELAGIGFNDMGGDEVNTRIF